VPTVVVGMRSAAQARANLDWAGSPLPASLWTRLAKLDALRPLALTKAVTRGDR
jgi:aryl-alcohol dehydrogenase-like predicted oxidoreductase